MNKNLVIKDIDLLKVGDRILWCGTEKIDFVCVVTKTQPLCFRPEYLLSNKEKKKLKQRGYYPDSFVINVIY